MSDANEIIKKRLDDLSNIRKLKLQTLVDEKLNEHLYVLLNKRLRLVSQDDYGQISFKAWISEIDYFISTVLNPYSLDLIAIFGKNGIRQYIFDYCESNKHLLDQEKDIDKLSPQEFEDYCANLLEKAGWSVKLTPISGDQGVDIIATMSGKILALQCKKYTSPIGNSAVQEVTAGKKYYQADFAAVVSNQPYTSHARKLADSCGVLLLHYSDLKDLTL